MWFSQLIPKATKTYCINIFKKSWLLKGYDLFQENQMVITMMDINDNNDNNDGYDVDNEDNDKGDA